MYTSVKYRNEYFEFYLIYNNQNKQEGEGGVPIFYTDQI